MYEKMILQKRRDFSDNISATFEFLQLNFKPLFTALIMIGGPVMLIVAVIIAYMSINPFSEGLDPSNFTSVMITVYSNVFLNSLLSMVVYILLTSICLSFMKIYKDVDEHTEITTQMVWEESRRHLGHLLLLTILVGFSVMIGALFLLIPGFILFIYLSISTSLVVLDDQSSGSAYSNSFDFLSGYFWSTFGLLLIIYIISFILSILVGLPNIIITGAWEFSTLETDAFERIEPTSTKGLSILITGIISNFGSYLISVLPTIALAFQYFNIKEHKESTGLINQISQMGSDSFQDQDETY